MANEEIASQVLDYWFAIEFLGQDSYDVCTEESKLVRALKTCFFSQRFAGERTI